jgi:alpha-D-xyloside xylohydrolase
MLLPLFFDFPQDESRVGVDDQFMFEPDLLAAPVLVEGVRSREVVLPAGTTWMDVWTGAAQEGGQRMAGNAPLEHIPLRLRGDAKLPVRADGV